MQFLHLLFFGIFLHSLTDAQEKETSIEFKYNQNLKEIIAKYAVHPIENLEFENNLHRIKLALSGANLNDKIEAYHVFQEYDERRKELDLQIAQKLKKIQKLLRNTDVLPKKEKITLLEALFRNSFKESNENKNYLLKLTQVRHRDTLGRARVRPNLLERRILVILRRHGIYGNAARRIVTILADNEKQLKRLKSKLDALEHSEPNKSNDFNIWDFINKLFKL